MNSDHYSIERCIDKQSRARAKILVTLYHSYIKWADRPSRKMYYLLRLNGASVGVFGLGSAFNRNNVIKEWMLDNDISFNELANNIVYCLKPSLPKNSGTRFLAMVRRDARLWWKERYGDTLKGLQTFILPPRTGAMYKADNWSYLGMTAGNTAKMITLYGDDPRKVDAERRIFKSGEVKYLYRVHTETPAKLMFGRIL